MNGLSLRENHRTDRLDDLLTAVRSGKGTLRFPRKAAIYSQGDPADSVYYLQSGKVKISVVSFAGKEATLSIVGPNDFFGVCCLSPGSEERLSTASAIEPSQVIRIEKSVMMKALREQPLLLDSFLGSVLKRTLSLQKDLCTQILDPSEKRLARTLLNLAPLGERDDHECVRVPRISHDTLASMVGTTRSRVTYFLNQFRNRGYIGYDNGIVVHPDRLTAVIQQN
jgi:CRP/FNR family cyclic AMP-dependent transcriptional regulator